MLLVLAALGGCAGPGPGAAADAAPSPGRPAADPDTLVAMTFNLRHADEQPPHAWSERRPLVVELIERAAPDVLGTQEGLYQQVRELARDLPAYRWIGTGRDGGSRGEFMAVFYRHDRFEPVAYDHYWLSDTPDVIGSATWGNANRRMVTWVRLRERATGRELVVVDTHFDHEVERAREESGRLLLSRTREFDASLPIIVTGDFNAAGGTSRLYGNLVLSGAFSDSWFAGRIEGDVVGTWHDWREPDPDGDRIDWILYKGPLDAVTTTILTAPPARRASDHFAVVATLRFEPSSPDEARAGG